MRKYMKSKMPFHGVAVPEMRAIARRVFSSLTFRSRAEWRSTVWHLWKNAEFREERYAAIALTRAKISAAHQSPSALGLYERMIVTGAWWDYVDEIATHCVGPILRISRTSIEPILRSWSLGPDLWKRRTAIICQIGFKAETDTELLESCIAPSLASREFFLRKAIGWALREYSKTDPEWVRRYVRSHEGWLSPLSKKEALRHVGAG